MIRNFLKRWTMAALACASSAPAFADLAPTPGSAGVTSTATVLGTGTNKEISGSASTSLTILGDSTIHKWTIHVSKLDIKASSKRSISGGSIQSLIGSGALSSLEVNAPDDGLKSTEGSSMDANTYKAMESTKFPSVHFSLEKYDLTGDTLNATGLLTIHGITKEIVAHGALSNSSGQIELKGNFSLLMSDYGIKPPVIMLGAIRVADKVTIVFDSKLAELLKN
jgi:hypothetical protein